MPSDISTVYDNLAGTGANSGSVAVGSSTPTVYRPADLRLWIDSADTPARLLLPVGGRQQGSAFEYINYGHSEAQLTWRITDLLLWRNIQEGLGFSDVAADLLTYKVNYLTMLLSFIPAASEPLFVSGAVITLDEFEWPLDSNQFYFGAEAVLSITEYID